MEQDWRTVPDARRDPKTGDFFAPSSMKHPLPKAPPHERLIRESRPMPGTGRLLIRLKRRLNPQAASGSAKVSASGCALSRPSSNRPVIRAQASAGADPAPSTRRAGGTCIQPGRQSGLGSHPSPMIRFPMSAFCTLAVSVTQVAAKDVRPDIGHHRIDRPLVAAEVEEGRFRLPAG